MHAWEATLMYIQDFIDQVIALQRPCTVARNRQFLFERSGMLQCCFTQFTRDNSDFFMLVLLRRSWMALEPIFASDDIKRQLPQDCPMLGNRLHRPLGSQVREAVWRDKLQ